MFQLHVQAIAIMETVYSINLYTAIDDISPLPRLNKERSGYPWGPQRRFLRDGIYHI